jgi:hypothetical protein
LSSPLTLGLYVNNFVYFLADPAVEAKFEGLLQQYSTVHYMGTVEWFLGTHFQWLVNPGGVKVHLSQTGFASHLVEENDIHLRHITPDTTPYPSGLPFDACPESDEDETNPTFLEKKMEISKHCWFHWVACSINTPRHIHHIPFCRPIVTNRPEVISMRLFTSDLSRSVD